MSQNLRDFCQPAFLNLLLFVGTLSVEAVSFVSTIGIIEVKPAQADPPHIPVPASYLPTHNYQPTSTQTPPHQPSLLPKEDSEQQTSSLSPRRSHTSSTPPSTPVVATANPSKRIIPAGHRELIERPEDQLIQQISGKAPIVRTVFHPPSPEGIPFGKSTAAVPILPPQPGLESASSKPSVNGRTTGHQEILVTAKTSSDLGLNLFASKRDSETEQTAQSLSPTPLAPSGTPVTDPRGNPLEGSPGVNPPSALPSERTPTQPGKALNSPTVQLQGVYLLQGNQSSARARVSGVYPLTPYLLAGATIDITKGTTFADERTEGLNINELYLAASIPDVPNLRFVVGKLDLTSYFDRNSFAKDAATHFFNPIFQTNPALSATGISDRVGGLVNWSLTDNIETKAAIFSSGRSLGNFSLDGFAGEVGIRYGNAIIRGTYVSDRDAGVRDGFREIYGLPRGNGQSGILSSDREESYGINGEVFIPNLKLGLFGRYGHYENDTLRLGGNTYSLGFNFLDLFAPYDRLGIAYGQDLSNNRLRLDAGNKRPDVLEAFYDFRLFPGLRLGLTLQERNNFSETVLGVRVKTEFDFSPINR